MLMLLHHLASLLAATVASTSSIAFKVVPPGYLPSLSARLYPFRCQGRRFRGYIAEFRRAATLAAEGIMVRKNL